MPGCSRLFFSFPSADLVSRCDPTRGGARRQALRGLSHVAPSGAFCLRQNAQRAALRAAGQATRGGRTGGCREAATAGLTTLGKADREEETKPVEARLVSV